jgi:hypothetical protein
MATDLSMPQLANDDPLPNPVVQYIIDSVISRKHCLPDPLYPRVPKLLSDPDEQIPRRDLDFTRGLFWSGIAVTKCLLTTGISH